MVPDAQVEHDNEGKWKCKGDNNDSNSRDNSEHENVDNHLAANTSEI
jgi:hypothetical protein